MKLFKEKKKKTLAPCVLALDIGTHQVKALITEIHGKRGQIIGVGRCKQSLGTMQSGVVIDIGGVIDNCHIAIEEALTTAKRKPDKVTLGIAGELIKGHTTTISYERENHKAKISMSELKNIVHKVQWRAFEKARRELAVESGYSEIDVKLVNSAIVSVEIDGHRVSNPLGFQGKEVLVSIYNAFAPLIHLGALKTIASELNMELLAITAEPYAVSKTVTCEEDTEFSAILIDIGGGTTDVALINKGAIQGTKMFAVGGRTITKRIASTLNISFDEAEEVKYAYSKGELVHEDNKVIRQAIEIDLQLWRSGIELSLQEFKHVETLPSRILLCGGGSALPEIKDLLLDEDWLRGLPFSRTPRVSFIQPRNVSILEDKTGELISPADITPMGLATLALELSSDKQVIKKVLTKIVRMMKV